MARYHPAMLGACLVAAAAVACTDTPPTAPTPRNAVFAKGGPVAGPKVSSTDPSSGARNTILVVRVLGSGYSQGTRAVWALKGDTTFAVTKVKTNSTTFVSSTELVANITIQGDASLALYDVVAITPAGKKGIGIELFTVIIGITDLGTLGGGQSFAYAVNADGVIVGEADQTGGRRAVRWTVTNGIPKIEDLTTVASFPAGTTRSQAFDVNNSGLVAGGIENANGVRRAFLLAGNVVTDLGVLPGDSHSSAAALNDANPVHVVGASGSSAVLWTVGIVANMQALPHLSLVGGTSWATGVNGTGTVVVGYSYVPGDLSYSAVRWQQDGGGVWTVTELPLGDFAGATDLNERGDATGSRRSATGSAHAYFWPTGGGSPVDLGTLGGSTSHALGINGAGETVGWSYNRVGVTRAFWRSGNGMTDLGTLMSPGSGAAMAEAINDAGLVVGSSQSTGGSGALWHAVLWTTR